MASRLGDKDGQPLHVSVGTVLDWLPHCTQAL